MAAGLGFKDFVTGEVLTAADVDGYLMQGIWVFASNAARDAAVTSPQEGNFAFTKDTNSLWYYDGAAWVASGATGDIEGVTAGIGISGGGTSGTVTVTNSMATAIDAKGDLVVGTGADTFSKLTVGANGTTLVADSSEATGLKWAAASGGGGANWSLLNSGGTTLSGTSVSITGISGKDKIMVLIKNASFSSGVADYVSIRFNSDSGSNYYQFGPQFIYAASYTPSQYAAEQGGSRTGIVQFALSNNAGSIGASNLLITGCNAAGAKVFQQTGGSDRAGGTDQYFFYTGGYYDSSSTISSVQIIGAATFDGGTVYVYTSA